MTRPLRRPHWLDRDTFDRFLDREAPLPMCRHCGAIDDLAVDHIVPRYAGGTDDLSNLQPACRSCNSRKGIRNDSYWEQQFYWDTLPNAAGFAQLREAQRQLFLAIDQDPYFECNPSEIARLLYIAAWIVGSGKTLGIAVAGWALNNAIRRKWGRATRRVDRLLVLCKEQAIRDQIAHDLPSDLVKYGVVTVPPRVHIVTDGDQFKQTQWLDECDVVVCCIQQLWTKNNAPRPDLPQILARFALINIDEPHFAHAQVETIVEQAASSVCMGWTGSPIDRAGRLLERMITLSIYDYQDAVHHDRSLKYLSADPADLMTQHVRVMNLQDAAISLGGQSAITTTSAWAPFVNATRSPPNTQWWSRSAQPWLTHLGSMRTFEKEP